MEDTITLETLRYSPHMSGLFSESDQKVILDYIDRQNDMYKFDTLKNKYFAIRESNGLQAAKRIDIFINEYGLILLSETEGYKTI